MIMFGVIFSAVLFVAGAALIDLLEDEEVDDGK